MTHWLRGDAIHYSTTDKLSSSIRVDLFMNQETYYKVEQSTQLGIFFIYCSVVLFTIGAHSCYPIKTVLQKSFEPVCCVKA